MNLIVCNCGFPKGKPHMYSMWKCISVDSKNKFISSLDNTTNIPPMGVHMHWYKWHVIDHLGLPPSMKILMSQSQQDLILTPIAWNSSSSALRINAKLCTWFGSIQQFCEWFWVVGNLIVIRFVFMVPHWGSSLGWGRKMTLVVGWGGLTSVSWSALGTMLQRQSWSSSSALLLVETKPFHHFSSSWIVSRSSEWPQVFTGVWFFIWY